MPKAIELLRQGKQDQIWQMCNGYLKLDIEQFMAVQKRLLQNQIEALNNSRIGKKIFNGALPQTVDDFRKEVPLTNYSAYCPELAEKREETLPEKPIEWVHTSGKTGEYACKWIPLTAEYVNQLSRILYGIGLLSGSKKWGDSAPLIECPRFIYSVAPRPWISGSMANMLQYQTPSLYYPSASQAESVAFEERIKMAFEEALTGDLDYFFGLSLVLVAVGTKFAQSAGKAKVMPRLSNPTAFMRLAGGMMKSRLQGRTMLPKDLWKLRGIISSGPDSSIYKEKIKEYWGRYPLDIYACTEGGVIATQTWDYEGLTFIPHLNFLEFIPEKEHLKWRLDHRYQPKTVLLDEVHAGECYEIVITSFHKGALVRYRVGDMIRISSLTNSNLGINIPQMVFERRADDFLDFAIFRVTEKTIWQAIENTGIPYVDWVAYKKPGEPVLNICLELAGDYPPNVPEIQNAIYRQILKEDNDPYATSENEDVMSNMLNFQLKLSLLPQGAFARYKAQKQAEGADLAHLKPPHINPTPKILALLQSTPEITVIDTRVSATPKAAVTPMG